MHVVPAAPSLAISAAFVSEAWPPATPRLFTNRILFVYRQTQTDFIFAQYNNIDSGYRNGDGGSGDVDGEVSDGVCGENGDDGCGGDGDDDYEW